MAKTIICDRCGSLIAVSSTKAIPFNSGHCVRMFDKTGFVTSIAYDLCGKCDDELAEFLKKKE